MTASLEGETNYEALFRKHTHKNMLLQSQMKNMDSLKQKKLLEFERAKDQFRRQHLNVASGTQRNASSARLPRSRDSSPSTFSSRFLISKHFPYSMKTWNQLADVSQKNLDIYKTEVLKSADAPVSFAEKTASDGELSKNCTDTREDSGQLHNSQKRASKSGNSLTKISPANSIDIFDVTDNGFRRRSFTSPVLLGDSRKKLKSSSVSKKNVSNVSLEKCCADSKVSVPVMAKIQVEESLVDSKSNAFIESSDITKDVDTHGTQDNSVPSIHVSDETQCTQNIPNVVIVKPCNVDLSETSTSDTSNKYKQVQTTGEEGPNGRLEVKTSSFRARSNSTPARKQQPPLETVPEVENKTCTPSTRRRSSTLDSTQTMKRMSIVRNFTARRSSSFIDSSTAPSDTYTIGLEGYSGHRRKSLFEKLLSSAIAVEKNAKSGDGEEWVDIKACRYLRCPGEDINGSREELSLENVDFCHPNAVSDDDDDN